MRREYQGAAQKAKLTAPLGGATTDLTINCDALTGWPTGAGGRPFYVVIGRGTPLEEKILCISRSGNTLTVINDGVNAGRGADGTSVTTHGVGDAIEHVFTAVDADEANAHVNATTNVHGVSGSLVGTTGSQTLEDKTMSGADNTFSDIPQSAVTGLATSLAAKANLSGATFTGEVDVVSATAAGSTSARQITISTADPTGGADGDLWVKYV